MDHRLFLAHCAVDYSLPAVKSAVNDAIWLRELHNLARACLAPHLLLEAYDQDCTCRRALVCFSLWTKHGRSSFGYAAQNGHTIVVEYLLEAGANINYVCTYHGKTLLHFASQAGHYETVSTILRAIFHQQIISAAQELQGTPALAGPRHRRLEEMSLAVRPQAKKRINVVDREF